MLVKLHQLAINFDLHKLVALFEEHKVEDIEETYTEEEIHEMFLLEFYKMVMVGTVCGSYPLHMLFHIVAGAKKRVSIDSQNG